MTTKSLDKRVRISHLTTSRVIKALLEGPCTAAELAAASGLHQVTIYEFMRSMRKLKVSHICGWEPDSMGRDAIAVFALGRGNDAKRRTQTRAEIARRYRERKLQRMAMAALATPNQQLEKILA